MEASGAGLAAAPAAGDAAQQQQGQQEGQQPAEQAPGGIPAELAAQLASVPDQLEQMRTWMEESAQQQQQAAVGEEQVQEPAPVDLSFVDPNAAGYDPARAAQELLNVLEQQTQTAVEKATQPLNERLQTMQTEREADFLAQEFPELADPKVSDQVFSATQQWVAAAGLPPEAAQNVQVIRAVFMMGRAAELHNAEQTPAAAAASLEGAGGASPGGAGGGNFTAESIVGTGGRSVLPFG